MFTFPKPMNHFAHKLGRAGKMDLFEYNQPYGLLICKPCAYAIPPSHLRAHMIAKHEQHVCNTTSIIADKRGARRTGLSRTATLIAKTLQETYNLVKPRTTTIPIPPVDSTPIPGSRLHRGYQCSLCPLIHCSQQSSGDSSLRRHFNSSHRAQYRRVGRPSKVTGTLWKDEEPIFHEVDCQRFFVSGHQSSFQGTAKRITREEDLTAIREGDIIRDIVNKQLSDNSLKFEKASLTFRDQTSKTEVSPWLDITRQCLHHKVTLYTLSAHTHFPILENRAKTGTIRTPLIPLARIPRSSLVDVRAVAWYGEKEVIREVLTSTTSATPQ
ncbi:hypothetical protein B0J12DRAFT_208714 [Macrophomina phaseolina]|uniref:C2H2-type domain-containing protein n=1 Tax=Macrophomina phaseolina TaxID=35725 RepID=A0ABQ8G240_9PEZI|nr:hypothetical protein B0J12DRAFT_208714 [Macrophomina phaseolina]